MTDNFDNLLDFGADGLDEIKLALDGINISAERVSRTMTRTFASAIVGGKSFETVLKSLAEQFARMALGAGLRPLQQGFSSLLASLLPSLGSGAGAIPVAPFADGGIVSRPTFFGAGGGLGLMGERGAEAIVPLARGPDGRLGLASNAAAQRPVHVNVHIATPDAAGFRRSQVQIESAIARAVARGGRGL